MDHMNTMLFPIDVFVYWEYYKHRETSHTSLFKQIYYFLRLKNMVRVQQGAQSVQLRCPIWDF